MTNVTFNLTGSFGGKIGYNKRAKFTWAWLKMEELFRKSVPVSVKSSDRDER